MKIKFIYFFSIGVLLLALLFGFTLFVWKTKAYDPLTFNEEPIPTNEKVVQIGQPITVHFDYCKHIEGPEEVESELVGIDIKYSLPDSSSIVPKGCGVRDAVVFIPKDTKPGMYHIEYSAVYELNPIRKFTEKFKTVDFEVIPPPGAVLEVIPAPVGNPVSVPIEAQ